MTTVRAASSDNCCIIIIIIIVNSRPPLWIFEFRHEVQNLLPSAQHPRCLRVPLSLPQIWQCRLLPLGQRLSVSRLTDRSLPLKAKLQNQVFSFHSRSLRLVRRWYCPYMSSAVRQINTVTRVLATRHFGRWKVTRTGPLMTTSHLRGGADWVLNIVRVEQRGPL